MASLGHFFHFHRGLWERVWCPYMWLAVGITWFSCFWRFWRCCGVFQGWVWLTIVVPSILRAQWVHIRALSVDSDASGSFLGSLKGLEIAISLCDSEMIFLFFTILTMLWCFPAEYGWQKLFRAYCGYNGFTLGHFQSILMSLGRLGGLWMG